MHNSLPNFLIVGAPKCGTTSLYHYLMQHPEVYMSPKKEPKFVTAQFVKLSLNGPGDNKVAKSFVTNFDDYKRLFKDIKGEKAIGEASADNLYFYKSAIEVIKEYLGNVKIIIVLRNPLERAFSHYLMFIRDSREYLSFEDALKAEEERKDRNWVFGWHYQSVGFYYNQVKAYLENFTQVRVYLYDDLKEDSLGLVKNMYIFLGVDTSFTPDTSARYNISGIPQNKFLYNLLTKVNSKRLVKTTIGLCLSEHTRRRLIERFISKNFQRPQMRSQTRHYLRNLYRKDILELQDLIRRDLRHWLD